MTQSGTEQQNAPVQTMTAPHCTCCEEQEELFLRDDPNDPRATNGAPKFALCLSSDPPTVYTFDVNAGEYIADPTHRVDANTGAIISNIAGDAPPAAGGDFTSDDEDDDGLPSPSGGAKVDLSRDSFYAQTEKEEKEEKPLPLFDSETLNSLVQDFMAEFTPSTTGWSVQEEIDEYALCVQGGNYGQVQEW